MLITSKSRVGFTYDIEHVRNGKVLSRETVHNIVPTEGLNHLLSVSLNGGSQLSDWYLTLYEGNYTPVIGVTASTVVAAATECTAYDEAARVPWTPSGAPSAGVISNVDDKAEFTMSATKTVYGGFLISSSAKSAGTGVLMSIVRFATAKAVEDNDILRIAAGITLVNAE